MTAEQLARKQRDFLIDTEKQSAAVIFAEFDRMKREFSEYLARNYQSGEKPTTLKNLYAANFLERLLLFLDNQLERISIPFSGAVAGAQKRMINFTGGSLKQYLPEISSSIFEPDKEAIRQLIGRTQTGASLQKFFSRLRPTIAQRARQSLIEGFAAGESSRAIAKRLNQVADIGQYRSLVISRNETVMAYRNASVGFFDEAGITEYRFLSVLDPRTCLICWRLHGTIWKLKITPHIHTQCRCSIVPVLKSDGRIKSGVERFGELETGFQKQILGAKRFEMFQSGVPLEDFVSFKESPDFGKTYIINPLSEAKDRLN